MRRLALLIAALLVPLLPAAPAYAATNVICVAIVDPSCSAPSVATIQQAISAANTDGQDSTILVGSGTYDDGPYVLDGTVDGAVTLRGAGAGSTLLTLPPSATGQSYVHAQTATLEDFSVTMVAADSSQDYGLDVYAGTTVDGVTVEGTGLSNATAAIVLDSQLSNVTLSLPGDNRAVYSTGGSTVRDGVLTANYGFVASSDPVAPDTLTRLTINARIGVTLDGGVIDIDNSVVRLTAPSGGFGLLADNPNNGTTPKTINADHVTIVGGGPGSVGVAAFATASAVQQSSLVTLDDSIVHGPLVSLAVAATNDGSPGGDSEAWIHTSYSSWDADTQSVNIGSDGTGAVVPGAGVLDDPEPLFVDPAVGDFRLRPTSVLVDVGNPAAGGPAMDRDRLSRVVDGNGDGVAVRDMGAYEYRVPTPPPPTPPAPTADTVAPKTTFTKKPPKRFTSARVRFKFTSNEAGSTFQCRRPPRPWRTCASPLRFKVTVGKHVFRVRATDPAGNVEPRPARYTFERLPSP